MVCLCCPKYNSTLSSIPEGWSCKYCKTSFDSHMKELETYVHVEELNCEVYSETSEVIRNDRNHKLS